LIRALRLSAREGELLRASFYDERIDALAAILCLSPHTIRTYRDRVYRKVGVRSWAQLFAAAFATCITNHLARIHEGRGADSALRTTNGD